jgi:four helix bundle protein
MAQPTFDHERVDVCRLSIEYVGFSYQIAKGLTGINRPARAHWLQAAQSIPLNIAEGNGKQSLRDKNRFFEVARGSALECASIHDFLRVCDAIDEEPSRRAKSDLKRIVSMLTRLIQRRKTVADGAIEYEYVYEYRDAEYEYEAKPEARRIKKRTRVADRGFTDSNSLGRNGLISIVRRHESRN